MLAAFLIAFKFLLQYIRKKEKPENSKHDKQFNQDDAPEFFSPGHGLETIAVKPINPFNHDLKFAKKKRRKKGIQIYLFLPFLNNWIFYLQTLGNPSNSTDICYYT
jgi:hypothetical protein